MISDRCSAIHVKLKNLGIILNVISYVPWSQRDPFHPGWHWQWYGLVQLPFWHGGPQIAAYTCHNNMTHSEWYLTVINVMVPCEQSAPSHPLVQLQISGATQWPPLRQLWVQMAKKWNYEFQVEITIIWLMTVTQLTILTCTSTPSMVTWTLFRSSTVPMHTYVAYSCILLITVALTHACIHVAIILKQNK